MRKLSLDEIGRVSPEAYAALPKAPLVVVLDNVRSMNNVGVIFRTADAYRAACIYLCGFTATPPHREIQKTALGATEIVPWRYVEHTSGALNELRAQGYFLIAAELTDTSVPLPALELPEGRPVALVLGHEIDGVSDEALALCDVAAELPQYGVKHSLNVAVAAGIFIYDLFGRVVGFSARKEQAVE